jgi:hypothetical protein
MVTFWPRQQQQQHGRVRRTHAGNKHKQRVIRDDDDDGVGRGERSREEMTAKYLFRWMIKEKKSN